MNKFVISCTFAATALCVSSMNQSCHAFNTQEFNLESVICNIDKAIDDKTSLDSMYQNISSIDLSIPISKAIGFKNISTLTYLKKFKCNNKDLFEKLPRLALTTATECMDRLLEIAHEEKHASTITIISTSFNKIKTAIFQFLPSWKFHKKINPVEHKPEKIDKLLKACNFSGIKSMPIVQAAQTLQKISDKQLTEIVHESIRKVFNANLNEKEIDAAIAFFESPAFAKIKEKRFEIIQAIASTLEVPQEITIFLIKALF